MTLSSRLLKEFDKLIGEMEPDDKEQFRIELANTRNPDGTRTIRSSAALLKRIIKRRSPEEQREITERLFALSNAEKEEAAANAINSVINMSPQESLEVMGAVNDLLEQKHMGGRSRRKRVKRKRTKRTIKR